MFECAICGDIDSYTPSLLNYQNEYFGQVREKLKLIRIVVTTPTYIARCSHCKSAIDVQVMDDTNFIVREIIREYLRNNSVKFQEYIKYKL